MRGTFVNGKVVIGFDGTTPYAPGRRTKVQFDGTLKNGKISGEMSMTPFSSIPFYATKSRLAHTGGDSAIDGEWNGRMAVNSGPRLIGLQSAIMFSFHVKEEKAIGYFLDQEFRGTFSNNKLVLKGPFKFIVNPDEGLVEGELSIKASFGPYDDHISGLWSWGEYSGPILMTRIFYQ
ncbi:hypothetical protein ACFL6U_31275 [Planctomycetota bacterium]